MSPPSRQDIAVIGSGVSGLSAAWLLTQAHRVTLYEAAPRLGGHANTVTVPIGGRAVAVDTGFIVYNEPAYPNLTALFEHLGIETAPTAMSFAVSLDDGRLEYNGTDLPGLFAQKRNLVNPRFWSMLRDLVRFYREAPRQAAGLGAMSLGAYLERGGYGEAFRDDHLLPMAAAIWSAPARAMLDHPADAFIRFCETHGLLKLTGRPAWRTLAGGAQAYVAALATPLAGGIRLGCPVARIERDDDGVVLHAGGERSRFDAVVLAVHADEALRLLADPDPDEGALLGAFRYSRNRAVLHGDTALMPRRRAAWASWNYLGHRARAERPAELCVSYWMNRLQPLPTAQPLIVTLNPIRAPRAESILYETEYTHPILDLAAGEARARLWSLQGRRSTWYCGAHFGAGFHEDGLQAGLAVAEAIGGVRRPWRVADESGRIALRAPAHAAARIAA